MSLIGDSILENPLFVIVGHSASGGASVCGEVLLSSLGW